MTFRHERKVSSSGWWCLSVCVCVCCETCADEIKGIQGCAYLFCPYSCYCSGSGRRCRRRRRFSWLCRSYAVEPAAGTTDESCPWHQGCCAAAAAAASAAVSCTQIPIMSVLCDAGCVAFVIKVWHGASGFWTVSSRGVLPTGLV